MVVSDGFIFHILLSLFVEEIKASSAFSDIFLESIDIWKGPLYSSDIW